MLGKILQLKGIPMENGFRVEEGVDFCIYGTADLRFATLTSYENPRKDTYKVTYCWGFHLEKQHDGFKEFHVNNLALKDGMPDKKDVEERLWVIIPWSVEIRTTAKKIAGRYPEEAILEMKLGDTVTVSKGSDAVETYMVVQGDNELFLVKKNR